ncbi:MAG: hypothetical protein F6K56_31375 [Moorea sp. SIO3G5]|nr:hypothetical protein [Moorena sp. SIO3G5]
MELLYYIISTSGNQFLTPPTAIPINPPWFSRQRVQPLACCLALFPKKFLNWMKGSLS